MSDSDSEPYLDVEFAQPSYAASTYQVYQSVIVSSSQSPKTTPEKRHEGHSGSEAASPQFAAPLAIGTSAPDKVYAKRRHSSELQSIHSLSSEMSDGESDDSAEDEKNPAALSELPVLGYARKRRGGTAKSSPYSSVEESSMDESNEDFETLKKLARMTSGDRRKNRSPQSVGPVVQRTTSSRDGVGTRFRRAGVGESRGGTTQSSTVKVSVAETSGGPTSTLSHSKDVEGESLTDTEQPSDHPSNRILSRRKSELFDFIPVKEGRFPSHGMRHSSSSPSANVTNADSTTPRKGATYELRRSRSPLTDLARTSGGYGMPHKGDAQAMAASITGGSGVLTPPASNEILDDNGEVIAGTVDQLISHFINHVQDQNFLRQIILAKEQFMTPSDFLAKLIELFNQAQTEFQDVSERTQYQIRIVNFLKKWFTTAPLDFKDEDLSATLQTFLSSLTSRPETAAWSNLLTVSWRASIDSATISLSVAVGEHEHESAPASLMSSSLKKASEAYRKDPTSKIWRALNLEDIPLEEVARQWTLIDYNLFRKMPFWELLGKRWENPELSPHVASVNERFNRVTRWVGTKIVQEFTAKKRAKMLTFIITLAEKLVQLRNYFGAMAIIFGISQSAISRLTSTWAKLSSSTLEKWKHLESIGNPTSNFKILRTLQESAVVPMVLAPTLLFRDMFFIEEGNEDWHDKKLRLINWEKVKLIGKIFSHIQRCNDSPYPYKHIPVLKKHLTRLYNLPDDEIEKASLIVEPHDD